MTAVIAITGGSGFAGRHIVGLLGWQGRVMRLLMRRPPRDRGSVGAEIVIGSLQDEASLKQLVAGAATVVHVAGAIAARNRDEFFPVNVEGTRRLAQTAAEAGVQSFIHISSLAAREPQLSDYGASKRAGEEVVADHRFDLTILRPPVVYGPGDRT